MAASAQPLWLVLLSLGLTGSLVGAVIAAVSNVLSDRFKRKFELQKWRAEFYVRPKLEVLRTLHLVMVRSHFEINERAKANMPQSIAEYQKKVAPQEKAFFKAHTLAEIYYDAETQQIMRTVLGSVRQMTTSIWLRLPENVQQPTTVHGSLREPDWKLFSESFDAAQERLRTILHPKELMKWAEDDD